MPWRLGRVWRGAIEDERGFTLIELLVVVIIIGILAAIAIPTYLSTRQSAYNADAKHTARTASSAALSYFQNNGTYDGMTAAVLNATEPSLPNNTDAPPYDNPGTYTVTETDTDFQINIRHSQGSETYRSTDVGTTTIP